MSEYISKETLQEKLNRKKAGPATKRYTDGWNDAILMVKSMIHSEKAADVAPVRHGRWEERDDGFGGTYYHCSVCGEDWCTIEGTPAENGMRYCPQCGARMDGDADD